MRDPLSSRSIHDALREVEETERANTYRCEAAADEAGYSPAEAANCEAGELRCPTCPWRNNNASTE